MIILFSDYSFWETQKCFTYVSLILATTSCLLKWHNHVTLSLPLFWTMVCKIVVLKLLFLSKALVHSESGYKQIRTSTCWGYKPWFVHLLLITNFKNVSWYDPDMKKGTISHVYHLLCFYVNHPPHPHTKTSEGVPISIHIFILEHGLATHHLLNLLPWFTSLLKTHCFSNYF